MIRPRSRDKDPIPAALLTALLNIRDGTQQAREMTAGGV
jgi:hypothetical protein